MEGLSKEIRDTNSGICVHAVYETGGLSIKWPAFRAFSVHRGCALDASRGDRENLELVNDWYKSSGKARVGDSSCDYRAASFKIAP